jgi:hypothetical protein
VPSASQAVPICHPGQSYNPLYKDHQNLLATALADEVKSIRVKAAAGPDASPPPALMEPTSER